MSVSSISASWNPILIPRAGGGWASYNTDRTASGAASETAGDTGSGSIVTSNLGTLIYSWSNQSTTPGMFRESGVTLSTDTSKNYQGQAYNLIATYAAGSAGVNNHTCSIDISSYNLDEVYIEYAYRFQRFFNAKWCKVFGQASPDYSNTTFAMAPGPGAGQGVCYMLHGVNQTSSNDTTSIITSEGNWEGGSAPPVDNLIVYNRVTAGDFYLYDDTWHRARKHLKRSKVAGKNGIFELWRDDDGAWTDSDMKFKVSGIVNQGDTSGPIQTVDFYNYSNGAQTADAYAMLADVKILSGGWSS